MHGLAPRAARIAAVTVVLALALPGVAFGVTLPGSTPASIPVPNGRAFALEAVGDTLYVGGDFTQFGPLTGPGIGVNRSDGARVGSFPILNNDVYDVISDESDGWYVAGGFDQVGPSNRTYVLHLLADGSLDPNFSVSSSFYGANSLALDSANGKLYVGGSFGNVSGAGTSYLMRVNSTTGATDTSWKPAPDSYVNELAIDPANNRLYVTGGFANIGGKARVGLALISTVDASADAGFSANLTTAADANSLGRAVVLGKSKLYVTGPFDKVAGMARPKVAQLDPATGAPTAWTTTSDGPIWAVAPDDTGHHVYVGGQFKNIGGGAHNGLARLDDSTGAADAWQANTPNYPNNSSIALDVFELARDGVGNKLIAVGHFTSITTPDGTSTRNGAVELDISDADQPAVTSWDPNIGVNQQPGYRATDVAFNATGAYIGGRFPIAGGVPRQRLAAIDARTGTLLPFSHDVNGVVYSLASDAQHLYAGGAFGSVDGGNTSGVVAFDLASGSRDFDFSVTGLTGIIYSLLPVGARLYVGGAIATSALWAFDSASGANLGAVAPTIGNGSVRALASDGSNVYAGGSFTAISGRDRLLEFDSTGAVVGDFMPAVGSAGEDVKALHLTGGTLYAGGSFTSPREHLAAFDSTSGAWTNTWTPPWATYPGSPGVYAMFPFDGNLWAFGKPTSVGPTYTLGNGGLGILDFSTGDPTGGFYPGFDQEIEDAAIAGGRLWIGGLFSSLGFPTRAFVSNFAAFDFPAPEASAPEITGAAIVGRTLTCSDPAWSNGPVTVVHEWLRDGSPIAGASAVTYVVAADDQAHQLTCRLTATAPSGARGTATSAPVSVPAPPAPPSSETPPSSDQPSVPPDHVVSELDKVAVFAFGRFAKLTPDARGRVSVAVSCGEGFCAGRLVLSATVKKRKLSLGSANFRTTPGSSSVKVKLTKAGRAALAKARKLKVVLTASAKDPFGNSVTVKKTATLVAPKKKSKKR